MMEKKSSMSSILRLITGTVLAVAIVSPWTKLNFTDFQRLFSYSEMDASHLVTEGQMIVKEELSLRIKERVQSYILDKASALNLEINTDVVLTDESPPSIDTIKITGAASPYAKQRMMQMLYKDLGVAEEYLDWP